MNNQKIKMLQKSPIKLEKEEEFFEYKKDNYDIDTPDKNFNTINSNKIKNEFELLIPNKNLEEKAKKNEEYIVFPKTKEDEENKINRISNLKDNELPLEDKIQIENQVDNDNDNESEQIEVIENILNNFGNEKEKYKKKFLEYKNNKKRFKKKSQSATNTKNSILNKIKHDIAIINFEREINKISNHNKHNLILKGEKLNINIINNNQLKRNNSNKNKSNILRIEEIRKKLSSGINTLSKAKSIATNHQRNENKIFINKTKNETNFYNSSNNFYNNKQKQKIYENLFNNTSNIKEIKINNFNINQIYNNFYDTFRNKRINNEYENKILPPNMTLKYKNNNFRPNDSPVNSFYNSNQFFYNVFINSVRKYPYLHLLKNKVNKMKNEQFSSKKVDNIYNLKKNEIFNEKKESILDKINKQKDIFQKEINKYKNK